MNLVSKLPFVPSDLHVSNRPSTTAQSVALMRAVEASRPAADRIVDDPYARYFLDAPTRLIRRPVAAARPVADLVERNGLTGISTYVLCRHAFIDAHLRGALGGGAEQVMILGAGYDSRAYRFAGELAGRPVYEVDLPPLSRRKAAVVARHPDRFGRGAIRRVEIDFRTQSLSDRLAGAGFATGRRTFVVWEGVAPYLSAAAVSTTLGQLRALCGPGSTVAMDLWDGGGTDRLAPVRRLGAWSLSLLGEPVTFTITPPEAEGLLGRFGFEVADLAEADELTSRYATLGRRAATSIYLVAATLRPDRTISR